MKTDFYHYFQLENQTERNLYMAYYRGIQSLQPKIITNIPEGVVAKLGNVHNALLLDHPSIFYLGAPSYSIANHKIVLYPQYVMSKEKIEEYQKKLIEVINSFLTQANCNKHMNRMQIMERVHDMLCEKLRYDFSAVGTKTREHLLFAHTILGVFLHKSAVCDAISKTYKLILNYMGIPCIIVLGNSQKNKNSSYPTHAWNMVKDANNQALHVDVTWDVEGSCANKIRHDFFMLTDEEIRKTHYF